MKKKITFKEWDSGKVVYRSCDVYIPSTAKNKVIRFDWDGLDQSEAQKIKSRQEQLFQENCSKNLELWKQIFKGNILQYKEKERYLENEKSDMRAILSIDEKLNIIYYEIPFLNHKKIVFTENSLREIRNYFQEVILVGRTRSYDYMHSPNFPYQHLSKTPDEVYAQVCWDFYKWLLSYKINSEIITNEREEVEISKIEDIVQGNKVQKRKIKSLLELLDDNIDKVKVVKDAINKLNISKGTSERQITAFVVVLKEANVLPPHRDVKLMRSIYLEIDKPIPENIKSRTDGQEYKLFYKAAKNYFGLTK